MPAGTQLLGQKRHNAFDAPVAAWGDRVPGGRDQRNVAAHRRRYSSRRRNIGPCARGGHGSHSPEMYRRAAVWIAASPLEWPVVLVLEPTPRARVSMKRRSLPGACARKTGRNKVGEMPRVPSALGKWLHAECRPLFVAATGAPTPFVGPGHH